MSSMSEYIDTVKEYQRATGQVIAAKDKEIARLEKIARLSDKEIAALKELLCRSIEGTLSEEAQKKILDKFRN